MNIRAIRTLAAALMLLLLLSPAALADFEAVVSSDSMKVYRQQEPHDQIGTLPKGTVVTVKDYNSKAALISYKGYKGIAHIDELERVKEDNTSSAELCDAQTMVTTAKVKVYKKASKSADYVKVNAGVELQVLSISGNVAKVCRDGVVGYMDASYLAEPGTAVEEDVVTYDGKSVITTESCKVYAKPTSSSAHMTIQGGVVLTLVATQGSWARVTKDGNTGYIDLSHLSDPVRTAEIKIEEPKAEEVQAPNTTDSVFSGSSEQICYKFFTKVMGYNTAAACGVMANIKYESDYKATLGGDNGTSYGICQWHLDRKTRLISWCNNHGYDYTTLKGQLYYLQYELKSYYPSVHSKLKAVKNSAQGAYDAGYEFCYNFEAPSSRASRSVTRGNYARDTLWGRYKA